MGPDRAASSAAGLRDEGRRPSRETSRREIVDGIPYLVDNGIKWCSMPAGFPPWRTIYGFARRWAAAGVLEVIRDQLRRRIRLTAGKTPQTASVIVDSQSVKASETVSKATRG